jgi:hypothetical protein
MALACGFLTVVGTNLIPLSTSMVRAWRWLFRRRQVLLGSRFGVIHIWWASLVSRQPCWGFHFPLFWKVVVRLVIGAAFVADEFQPGVPLIVVPAWGFHFILAVVSLVAFTGAEGG